MSFARKSAPVVIAGLVLLWLGGLIVEGGLRGDWKSVVGGIFVLGVLVWLDRSPKRPSRQG